MKTYKEIVENKRVFNTTANMGFIKLTDAGTCSVIWEDDENGWEHVSISPKKKTKIPTWNDMCQLKDAFFYEDEEVLQLHPKKSEYVNVKENVLHLWKPKGIDIMGTLEKAVKRND